MRSITMSIGAAFTPRAGASMPRSRSEKSSAYTSTPALQRALDPVASAVSPRTGSTPFCTRNSVDFVAGALQFGRQLAPAGCIDRLERVARFDHQIPVHSFPFEKCGALTDHERVGRGRA